MTMLEQTSDRDLESSAMIGVTSPATGAIAGQVPDMTAGSVTQLVEHARLAQSGWAAAGFKCRGALLLKLRVWMMQERRRIIDVVCAESGKTYEDALIEVFFVANAIGFWAKHAERYLRDERWWSRSPVVPGRRMVVRYEPYGVVGVIAPWNYPLVLGLGDAIPALMAGNAVVLKPSSITPMSTLLIVEEGMRAAGFPPDVCLTATGRGGAGSFLVDRADMIMFTGSTEVGKQIAARAAERLIPVSLELGGKDPMIVLADADLERAANTAVLHGISNCGQTCMAVERVYVEAPAYDAFVSLVEKKVRKLRQGPPGPPGTVDVGSLTGPGQIDLVARHVDQALRGGARVLCGGHRTEGGDFYAPTVLVDIDETMDCMTEETFGPLLPIVKVSDADEAVRLANGTPFGLNSSVFTRNVAAGEKVARRIEAGNCCVNDALLNYAELRAPFTGWKESGLGGRHGQGGIRKYCRQQTLLITRFAPRHDPFMFPRKSRQTRWLERLMVWAYGRG
jgi:acyl-CoA reductase-like NAD-dependent aldehyde dehydrogenase